MPKSRFSPLPSDHWGVIWPLFHQSVPLHEKCNVYIRLWEGPFSTHQLNLSRWQISLKLASFMYSVQSVFVRMQLKSPTMISKRSKYVSTHFKNFLSPVYSTNHTVHILLLYRRLGNSIPFPARMATPWFVTFIVSLVSTAAPHLFIPTFVYVLYPLIWSKPVWWLLVIG